MGEIILAVGRRGRQTASAFTFMFVFKQMDFLQNLLYPKKPAFSDYFGEGIVMQQILSGI